MNDPEPLTAILITHFHADHWFDLVPLHYAFRYGSWRDRPKPTLHLPPGGRDVLDTVASVWDGSAETFDAAFHLSEYDPGDDLRLGELHSPSRPACTTRLLLGEGRRPADGRSCSRPTRPRPSGSRALHRGRPVCLRGGAGGRLDDSRERGHMDAAEAGREAFRAGAKRLLLTHVPTENGHEYVRERAGKEYGGPIDLAMLGLRIEV